MKEEFVLALVDQNAIPKGGVAGCLNLAHTHLPAQELADIQLNDVILFDQARFIPGSHSQFNQQLTLNHSICLQLDIFQVLVLELACLGQIYCSCFYFYRSLIIIGKKY